MAKVVDDEERLRGIRRYIESLGSNPVVTRKSLRGLGEGSTTLSRTEAEAVLVGLLLGDAAEKQGHSSPYMEGEFILDSERAVSVVEEQIVAKRAFGIVPDEPTPRSTSRLVATTPPDIGVQLPSSVGQLGTQLRGSLLEARERVRLANPYFDPDQSIVDAIAELPSRGVTLQILTRQMTAGTDRYEVLQRMASGLSPEERERLEIRELFARDDTTGYQTYATHAKILIVDDEVCYIGSANLTVTSLSSNFELGVLLTGPEVGRAARIFDAVFEVSRPVSMDELLP